MTRTFAVLLLLTTVTIGTAVGAFTDVIQDEQSYFFGVKPSDNAICYRRTLAKGARLPAMVTHTSTGTKVINFVTIHAGKYSPYGFTVDKTDGQLGTHTVAYTVNGPSPLPYNIDITMFCAP